MREAKILVTGAGGFIGSHLTEQLVRQGKPVRAFVHYNSAGHRGWLEESPVASDIEFAKGDIRDFDAVCRAAQGCSVIFHLAALVGIPYSYVSPQAYLRTNIDGAFNVLESARATSVERVVLTSTSEIYGNAREIPINELHPVNCQSPYAASKAAADQLGLSYHRSFGVPVTLVRPFNTYGPRQSLRAVIPTIIAQLLSGDSAIDLGNPDPRRDFTFVEDTVAGFLAASAADSLIGEVVHIGNGTDVSVGELVSQLGGLTGRTFELKLDQSRVRPAASEVDQLVCDSGKLRLRTGWQPVVTLEEGLRRTIQWLEPRLAKVRAKEYSI
jgi:NAD dependent epimerase/dehydratase